MCGILNSAIFNSFHNRVEFGTILEGLGNFGGWGVLKTPNPPTVSHWEYHFMKRQAETSHADILNLLEPELFF